MFLTPWIYIVVPLLPPTSLSSLHSLPSTITLLLFLIFTLISITYVFSITHFSPSISRKSYSWRFSKLTESLILTSHSLHFSITFSPTHQSPALLSFIISSLCQSHTSQQLLYLLTWPPPACQFPPPAPPAWCPRGTSWRCRTLSSELPSEDHRQLLGPAKGGWFCSLQADPLPGLDCPGRHDNTQHGTGGHGHIGNLEGEKQVAVIIQITYW